MAKIIRIGLEGGDVAGKSDAEPFLRKKLEEKGVEFIFIPEVASRIINQYGLDPRELRERDPRRYFDFQLLILRSQLIEEALALEHAKKLKDENKLVVIATDRTCAGIPTYTSDEDYLRMLEMLEQDRMTIRDARYDAIIHMVTAADGALEAYQRSVGRNKARKKCPPDVAIAFDRQTQRACLGHPHHRIVDNSTDFNEKLERVWRHVERIIDPDPDEIEKKFWIYNRPDMSQFPVPFEPVKIFQTYLADSPGHRVRMRMQENGGRLYYETRKIPTEVPGKEKEKEKLIGYGEYLLKLKEKDLAREEIVKTRYHFIWKNQHFEMDFFHAPKEIRAITLLEVELLHENEPVEVPPFLGEFKEVTGDPRFKNTNLCKKSAAP